MKILVAEDHADSRQLLCVTLQALGHEVSVAENGLSAWEQLQAEHHPLVISDWLMPELDGLGLCRRIRAGSTGPYVYIILLTALAGKDHYLAGINAGADDFISKPFDQAHLAARLHVAERILTMHETLRDQAMHDHLTGLWNRGAIVDFLQAELQRAERETYCVAVLLLDLDHFKQINDRHGHPAGDAVLAEAARRMQAVVRSYDRVGRYGGEEFLVVLLGHGPEHVHSIAERMREVIATGPVLTPAGPVEVTASVGVALSRGRGESADDLVMAADIALYQAKKSGRNRVTFASSEVPAGLPLPELQRQ